MSKLRFITTAVLTGAFLASPELLAQQYLNEQESTAELHDYGDKLGTVHFPVFD